jgi:hypothetical protein
MGVYLGVRGSRRARRRLGFVPIRRKVVSHPLTIDVPEDVFSSLSRLAHEQGRTPESLAQDLISRGMQHLESDPFLKWIGAFESEVPDAAERHDHYLGEALNEELKGRPGD